jgi:hypothetical protein
MTTFDIESAANRGDVARDMNVGLILRAQVIPEFLEDVKACAWRKKWATVTTEAGVRDYALASDLAELREVKRVGYGDLEYIGEDAAKVFAAEEATENGAPTAYYLGRDADATVGHFRHLYLDYPADAAYTLRYNYYYLIPYSDTVTPIDLGAWIPEQYHWALIEGLKREIYEERFGLSDARSMKAAEMFSQWKSRALANAEVAKHGKYVVDVR